MFDNFGWLLGQQPPYGLKLIAKACYESASIGLSDGAIGTLSSAYEAMLAKQTKRLKQPYIVQEFISGCEAEVPVFDLGNGAFALDPIAVVLDGSPVLGDRILDYSTVEKDECEFAPCDHLDGAVCERMRSTAEQVFRTLGIGTVGRIDFRIGSSGDFWVTDVATTPHLVRHSSFAFAFHKAGFRHADVLAAVVGANATRLGWCQLSDQT
jgi:D-alanine-D-alanine ligase